MNIHITLIRCCYRLPGLGAGDDKKCLYNGRIVIRTQVAAIVFMIGI